MCGVEDGEEDIFGYGDEDWFGDKVSAEERRYREERRLKEINKRIAQDEIDFGDAGCKDQGGDAEPDSTRRG